ncbi:MAG: hypothetical protein JJU03_03815 [Idiomarina sp.]|nr:hypothetical protein [Idiomarina sp.]
MPQRFKRWLPGAQSNLQIAIALRQGRVNLAVCKSAKARGGTEDTQPRLIVNDEQNVEQNNYAHAIEILLARYPRLNLKGARTQLVLGPRLVQQTTIDRPQLSEAELQLALPWTLKDLIDIPPADLIADYYDPPIQVAGRDKVHVVAVQKSWLTKILQPLLKARVAIDGIVNEDLAMCSLLHAKHPPLMLVSQYGQQQAQLLLIKQRALVVSRQLKPLQSVINQSELDSYESESLAIELQRSTDYFSGQLRQASLQHVYLAFPGQQVHSLCEQLGQSLSLMAEPFVYPQWAVELAAGDFSDLGVLAGLAYMQPALGGTLAAPAHAEVNQEAPV